MKTGIGRGFRVLAAALLTSAGGALAANDVGLINHLAGDVSYASGAGNAAKALAFMKIREGDRFMVPAGATLRVVYFQGGRQESFSGPATFTAGAQQSAVQSGSPQVTTLPAGVPQKISQTPELIQIAKLGRTGGVAVRGLGREPRLTAQQQAEVRQARETYQKLRADAAQDDITPELFLYSVLQDHLMYADMKPVVDEMAKRQPGNPDVAELKAYVQAKTEPR